MKKVWFTFARDFIPDEDDDRDCEEQARETAKQIFVKVIESCVATREAVPSPNAQSNDQSYQSDVIDGVGPSLLPTPPTDGYGPEQLVSKAKTAQGSNNARIFISQNDRASGGKRPRRKYTPEERAEVQKMRRLKVCKSCKRKKKKCDESHRIQDTVAGGSRSQGQASYNMVLDASRGTSADFSAHNPPSAQSINRPGMAHVAHGQSIRGLPLEPSDKQSGVSSLGNSQYSESLLFNMPSNIRSASTTDNSTPQSENQDITVGNKGSRDIFKVIKVEDGGTLLAMIPHPPLASRRHGSPTIPRDSGVDRDGGSLVEMRG